MYIIKARYYANSDNFGETFVVTSDNREVDLKAEAGRKVRIVPLCSCGADAELHYKGKDYVCKNCFIEKYNK